MIAVMARASETEQQQSFFQRDIARLNRMAESMALFATVWLGRTMQTSYLPDHAKAAYIDYLAHNYNRRPVQELARCAQLLAYRLDQQFTTPETPFAAQQWYQDAQHLNALPPLPSPADERRFMRYLALRDLQEFTAAFTAPTRSTAHLRPWVRTALLGAMAQNQLERAWENSVTIWDSHSPPRPRTFVRAQFHSSLWQGATQH
jgi:hypothetical protein